MPDVILTAIGHDRPGLVDALTGFLHEIGANVADSSMINLRGRFAVMLLAEADDEQARQIQAHAPALADQLELDIDVDVQPAADEPSAGRLFRLHHEAKDQPGIVHRITHLLHQHRVNIEELQTRLEPGQYGQTPRFSMQILVRLPTDADEAELRSRLSELCEAIGSSVELEPADQNV